MTRRELLAALLTMPLLNTRTARAQREDLTALTIAQAAARLAGRAITPAQLTDAYLARITKLNPELNAYVTVLRDLARTAARRLSKPPQDSPLWGIPIAHKDLFETAGVRTSAGSLLFEHYTPEDNAAIVQRLEAAGAIMLGKTNTHELGGGVTTINPFFGTTRNPVNSLRIAGGSSGGSAAAVAARMCAAATGSDTGGSVRIPAAFCGCVGFKPTFGRISTTGLIGSCPTFDHVGFLTRTVEDAEILFRVALGNSSQGDANKAPVRVGVARNFFFDGVDTAVGQAVNEALEKMRARGATITDIAFPIDSKTMARVFDPIVVFEIWGRLGADWRTHPGSFSKSFAEFFSIERPTISEYEAAQAELKAYQANVDHLFESVDVVVTPTVPLTAPPIAGPIDGGRILRNTWPFNAAGTPAISVPCGTDASKLPIGLQLVARRGDDDKLLRIARTVEAGL